MLIVPARTAFTYSANERFNLAVVGMSGYGAYHGFGSGIHQFDNAGYTISCDVDLRKIQRVYKLWKERAAKWERSEKDVERAAAASHYIPLDKNHPPLYRDFRRMLDKEADRIDGVVVATPDHTHAVIAAAALRAGKPVFAEKPLTISAHEARALSRLAKEKNLPTQMNTHGAARADFRRGVEILREGLIGDLEQVHIFAGKGGLNFQKKPQGIEEIPGELEWNLWLAQVSWREYNKEWINRVAWRDTSLGSLGNAAPHFANMAFLALDLRELWEAKEEGNAPIRIEAQCSNANQLSYPRWEQIRWDIPARKGRPSFSITWHCGIEQPDYPADSRAVLNEIPSGFGTNLEELAAQTKAAPTMFVGNKGMLATNGKATKIGLFPKKKFENVEQRRPRKLSVPSSHYAEWVEACQGKSDVEPMSNFQFAAPFAEFLTVGSIATRFPGEQIDFDPCHWKNHQPRAGRGISQLYLSGWLDDLTSDK